MLKTATKGNHPKKGRLNMENKWEYDYSNLYNQNNQTQNQEVRPPENQQDPGAAPPPPPMQEPQQPKKKGHGRKILSRILALVLVAAVGFGGGYGGALLALKQNPQRVIYQGTTNSDGSVANLTTDTLDLTTVSSMVTPSVVAITTEEVVTSNYGFWFGGEYVQSGAGSGVIMTSDGYIITNQHVVEGASTITVTLSDDTEYPATLVGSDSVNDIAVIKIEAEGLTPAVMGNSDNLVVGQSVIAVGNPMGVLGGTVTNGIISALNRDVTVNNQKMTLIQTNAAISPGNSGGGLFDANGQLIGIVNAKSSGSNTEGLGFAIPINTALSVATDLIDNGYVTGRPALGITVVDVQDSQTAAQMGVSSAGVYVYQVNEGSGAEAAGIQPGDRIIAVENVLVENKEQVSEEVRNHNVGDTIQLQIARDGNIMNVEVTLGESQG